MRKFTLTSIVYVLLPLLAILIGLRARDNLFLSSRLVLYFPKTAHLRAIVVRVSYLRRGRIQSISEKVGVENGRAYLKLQPYPIKEFILSVEGEGKVEPFAVMLELNGLGKYKLEMSNSSSLLDFLNTTRHPPLGKLIVLLLLVAGLIFLFGLFNHWFFSRVLLEEAFNVNDASVRAWVSVIEVIWFVLTVFYFKLIYVFVLAMLALVLFIKASKALLNINLTTFITQKPQVTFLLISIPLGLYLVFVTPPFQAPDEQRHLMQSFNTALFLLESGKFNPSVGYLPRSLGVFWEKVIRYYNVTQLRHDEATRLTLKEMRDLAIIPLKLNDQVPYSLDTTYSPLTYLPQALAVSLGMRLKVGPRWCLYLGRLATLALYILLCYLALSFAGEYSYVLLMVALWPGALFIGSSLNPAGVANGIAFLLSAEVLRLIKRAGVSVADLLRLALWGVLLGLVKPTFAFLSFVVLSVPPYKLDLRNLRLRTVLWLLWTLTVIGVSFLPQMLWIMYLHRVGYLEGGLEAKGKPVEIELRTSKPYKGLLNGIGGFISEEMFNKANVPRKLRLLSRKPYLFLKAVKNLLSQRGEFLLNSSLAELGWLNYRFDKGMIILLLIFTFIVGLLTLGWKAELDLGLWEVLGLSLSVIVFIISRLFLMYLYTTPNDTIEGVSGRYFIPVSFLFALLVSILSLTLLRRLQLWDRGDEVMGEGFRRFAASLGLLTLLSVYIYLVIGFPFRFYRLTL